MGPNDQLNLENAGGTPTLSLPTWLGGSGFAIGNHPFGQDELGQDTFARTMKGTQTSLDVMFVIGIVAGIIGMAVGGVAGYYRGWLDQLLMRMTDLVITFPIIVIGAVLGKAVSHSGPLLLALCLGAITWTTLARLVRGEFLALREREFVDAAKVAGASDFRIMRKHMLPNSIGVIIVNTTLLMSTSCAPRDLVELPRLRRAGARRVARQDDRRLPVRLRHASVAVLVARHLHHPDRALGQLHR